MPAVSSGIPKSASGYLDQHAAVDETLTVRAYLSGAFADLFETERQLNELNEAISVCTDEDELYRLCTRAGAKQELLESRNFYAVDSEIDKIAAGLGLTAFGMDTKLGHLSGGQRAKSDACAHVFGSAGRVDSGRADEFSGPGTHRMADKVSDHIQGLIYCC